MRWPTRALVDVPGWRARVAEIVTEVDVQLESVPRNQWRVADVVRPRDAQRREGQRVDDQDEAEEDYTSATLTGNYIISERIMSYHVTSHHNT